MATGNDIPTLPAVAVRSGTWAGDRVWLLAVWCDHCRYIHAHGGGDHFGDGDGHRWCHCHRPGSPYQPTGYMLREVPAAHPDVADLVRRLRRDHRHVGRRCRVVALDPPPPDLPPAA